MLEASGEIQSGIVDRCGQEVVWVFLPGDPDRMRDRVEFFPDALLSGMREARKLIKEPALCSVTKVKGEVTGLGIYYIEREA